MTHAARSTLTLPSATSWERKPLTPNRLPTPGSGKMYYPALPTCDIIAPNNKFLREATPWFRIPGC